MKKTSHSIATTFTWLAICLLLIIGLLAFITWWAGFSAEHRFQNTIGTITTQGNITIGRSTEFYDISAAIPVEPLDKDQIMRKNFEQNIRNRETQWAIGGEIYNAEKQINADFPDRSVMKYEYTSNYEKVVSKKLGTVSYVFTTYEFTGGAHGSSYSSVYVFDKNGLLPGIDAIVRNDDAAVMQLLEKIVRPLLIESLDISTTDSNAIQMLDDGLGINDPCAGVDQSVAGCGFLPIGVIANALPTDEGLKIYFGSYQVAPYSAGLPDITIAWDTVKPYLTPEFAKRLK